ncbi:hypothetical protein PINS_up024190 [Pythium insidiosum]|nr:hypothetical protein PINS_up024190 [Pythium insidiosum]
MTGKTSLATLVSHALVKRHTEQKRRMVVFNFSALRISENETFEDVFKRQCGVDWKDAIANILPETQVECFLGAGQVHSQQLCLQHENLDVCSVWLWCAVHATRNSNPVRRRDCVGHRPAEV